MKCHYNNIFVLLLGSSCLQAGLNHTAPIGRYNEALTKVTDDHWKILLARLMIVALA